jgi:3',5'-cyclic AMP phosphodiesterase CpdA
MRLFILSDLHLENRPLAAVKVPAAGFDVLVCAGDLWEGEPERGVGAVAGLAAGRPAILVPGNHEHYRGGPADRRTAGEMLSALRAAAVRTGSVVVLEHGASAIVGEVAFIGTTLWTDWRLAGLWRGGSDPWDALERAVAQVSDPATGSREYLGAILAAADRAWHPYDALAAHRREKTALYRSLSRVSAATRVVVTHHAPLTAILDPYRAGTGVPWWIPAFYASTALADLPQALRPDLWVSGHFHAAHDLFACGTRCVANPVAAADYDPGFVVDLKEARAPSAAAG